MAGLNNRTVLTNLEEVMNTELSIDSFRRIGHAYAVMTR